MQINEFHSLNFKIVVIDVLLEAGYFQMEWQNLKDQFYDEDNFDFEPISEIINFCRNVEITNQQLEEIVEIEFDAALQIYADLIPNWSGEDSIFDVDDLSDITKLKNLQEICVISMLITSDIEPLLNLKNLKKIKWFQLNENPDLAQRLRMNGVSITN